MKKSLVIVLVLTSFKLLAQNPVEQITKEFNQIGGRISKTEASILVEKLYNEKVLNQTGKDILQGYLLENKSLQLFEKNENEASDQNPKIVQALEILKTVDSVFINKSVLLAFIGFIDIARMDIDNNQLDAIKKRKIKNVLGNLWDFKPKLIGDQKNPFSYKFNISENRNDYTAIMEAIKRTGLVDEKVLNDSKKWLEGDEKYIFKDFNVFLYAAFRNLYYDSYPNLKNKQTNQIDSLLAYNIIKPTNASALKNQLTNYQILYKTDIFGQSPNAINLIAANTKIKDKKNVIEYVFREINKLLPELKIENLTIKDLGISTDKSQFSGRQIMGIALDKLVTKNELEISADFNGKKYSRILAAPVIDEIELNNEALSNPVNKIVNASWVTAKDLQIVNDYLIDNGDKRRLFSIGDELTFFPKPSTAKRILILLDSTQFDLVKKIFLTANVGFDKNHDFERSTSIANLKQVYDNLVAEQIINPMAQNALNQKLIDLRKNATKDNIIKTAITELIKNNTTRFVKGSVFSGDMKQEEYNQLFANLKTASEGSFMPENLFNNFETENAKDKKFDRNLKFGFTSNQIVYQDSLTIYGKLDDSKENNYLALLEGEPKTQVEEKIMILVNTACENNEIKPKRYTKNFKEFDYIFLNNDQVDAISIKYPSVFEEIRASYVEESGVVVDSMGTDSRSGDELNMYTFINYLQTNELIDPAKKEMFDSTNIESLGFVNATLPFLKNSVSIALKDYIDKTEKEYLTDLYERVQTTMFPEIKYDFFKVVYDSAKYTPDDKTLIVKAQYSINNILYQDSFSDLHERLNYVKDAYINKGDTTLQNYDFFEFPTSMLNAYLIDQSETQRLLSFDIGADLSLYLASENFMNNAKLPIFGSASYETIKTNLKTLQAEKLIKIKPENEDLTIAGYRAINLDFNAMLLLNYTKSEALLTAPDLSTETKATWKTGIENLTKGKIKLDKYTDNKKSVISSIQAQAIKHNEEDKLKNIKYKGEYFYKNQKLSFEILLNKDDYYTLLPYEIFTKIITPLNAKLKNDKSIHKIYFDEYTHLYYLTNKQKTVLENLGLVFYSEQ
jgi:hypothetical protein